MDYGPAVAFDLATGKVAVTGWTGGQERTWQRFALRNGVFVVGEQAGLLAVMKDGKEWENNTTDPDQGDVQCVEFTRKVFIATTTKVTLGSADGKAWTEGKAPPARQVRRVGDWLALHLDLSPPASWPEARRRHVVGDTPERVRVALQGVRPRPAVR